MHLQGSHGGNEDDGIRGESGGSALDVEELFHPNVGSKASLRKMIMFEK